MIVIGNVGVYEYIVVFGLKFGIVLFVILLIWFMMFYLSYVIVNFIVECKVCICCGMISGVIWFVFFIGVILMVWDVVFDFYMLGKVKVWIWIDGGFYFGVLFMNFFGWICVVFLIDLVYCLFVCGICMKFVGEVKCWMVVFLVLMYVFNVVGDIFIGWFDEMRFIVVFVMGIMVFIVIVCIVGNEFVVEEGFKVL